MNHLIKRGHLRRAASKTLSVTLSLTTSAWLVGGSLFLGVPAVHAVTLVDGDLVKTAASPDVYIVKMMGADKFKRLILNPDIFNSYGHLSWNNIKIATQAEMDMYANSNLVIEVNADGSVYDPKVYAVTSAENSDVGEKRWLNVTAEEFTAAGLDWDSIYYVNHTEAAPSFYPAQTALVNTDNLVDWSTNVQGSAAPVPVPAPAPSSGLSVALAGTDPGSKVAAMGAQDVIFSTLKFTAGTSGNMTVSSVEVTRGLIGDGGIAADADFTNVKLYRNSVSIANKVGGTLTLNTTTHTAKFTNLNWTINAGQTDTLLITGSLATTGITGNIMMLGLRDAAAITLSDTAQTKSGTFPMFGTKISPASTAVGAATIKLLTTPGAGNVLSGSTDQALATLRFAPSATEDFKLMSVKFTQIQSANPADVTNLKLKYGTTVLATAAAMTGSNTVSFELSAPANENLVKASQTRDFTVYGDFASGINVSRIVRMSVQQAADVVAQGVTSGGLVSVTTSGTDCNAENSAVFPHNGCNQTIVQGSLTTALSAAYNPAAGNLVKGVTGRKGLALRFSASNDEAVRITQLKITETGTSVDADVSSIALAKVNSDGTVGATLASGTLSSGSVTFGTNTINAYDSNYLVEVAKGGNADLYVIVDVAASAGTNTIILGVAAAGDVKADGVSSQNDIPSASVTGTGTGNTQTIIAKGVVTSSTSGTTPAATYVKGAKDKQFGKFSFLVDSGENITISSLKLTFTSNGTGTALSTANSPTNVRVYKESVSSANLLGTVSSPSSGVANFGFTDSVNASTTRAYVIVADIPTTSGATAMYAELVSAANDIVVTGVSSGADIDPSAALAGAKMTVGTGMLTAIASSLPVYTDVTEKSSNVEVARFVLTSAIDGETVRVTSLKFTKKGTAANNKAVEDAAITSLTLYDVNGGDVAGTGVKSVTVGSLTSSAATFSGLVLDIPSGQQKVVGVKVNIGDSAYTYPHVVMGIENYYADIAASGLDSLSTIYANHVKRTSNKVLGELRVALAITDLDLTGKAVDKGGTSTTLELDAFDLDGTAVAANDVLNVGGELILVTSASASTVRADVTTATDRAGFAGTALVAAAAAVPVILQIQGKAVAESGNNTTAYATGDGVITFTTTVASTFAAGALHVAYDPDVDNQEDDIRVISNNNADTTVAVSTNGLSLNTFDAFSGTAVAEAAGANGVHVRFTNYGQAQRVQAVGKLTAAVSSATPAPHQAVAGASDVEFARLKLTSKYETVTVNKVVWTRTGGSDTDFASVYMQNLSNSTWGPNGNGKSNTAQLVGGVATFNLTDTYAIPVSYTVSAGVEIALKGNVNTVSAGSTSADAPKFYIAAVDATNFNAKGASTGTALVAADISAGTPTPATAANLNAQVIYKSMLSTALNSGSLSGNQTRSASQAWLKLDLASASNGSTATFRAGSQNVATATTTDFSPVTPGTDTDGDWVVVTVGDDASTMAASATNTIGSSGNSMLFTQGTTTPVAGNGLEYQAVTLDLSSYSGLYAWVRPSNATPNITMTLTGATAGSHTISGLTAGAWNLVDVPFSDATTAFTGLTAVTAIRFVSATAYTASDTVNIDNLTLYKDKVKLSLASNAGLFVTTAAQNTSQVDLKDGSTVLASGWYSGTTSAGNVTFVPTTQFTIPTTTKTLSVVADTTVLITGAKTLSATMDLGSANNAGTVTAGNIYWHDDSAATDTIKWIDSTPNPFASSTISYQ